MELVQLTESHTVTGKVNNRSSALTPKPSISPFLYGVTDCLTGISIFHILRMDL